MHRRTARLLMGPQHLELVSEGWSRPKGIPSLALGQGDPLLQGLEVQAKPFQSPDLGHMLC